jgi:hypothetical protein
MPIKDPQKRKEYNKKYYKKHRERLSKKNKEYYEKNKEILTDYRKKHYTGFYGSWYAMKQRCNNKNNKSYHNYGGRGITYDDKWDSFDGFKEDMADGYKSGLTLDRIDNEKGYFKNNCKWSTRKEQCNNQRKTVYINDKTFTELENELGINRDTIRSRYYRGMEQDEILKKDLFRPQKL